LNDSGIKLNGLHLKHFTITFFDKNAPLLRYTSDLLPVNNCTFKDFAPNCLVLFKYFGRIKFVKCELYNFYKDGDGEGGVM
jgi:hypothetical protein